MLPCRFKKSEYLPYSSKCRTFCLHIQGRDPTMARFRAQLDWASCGRSECREIIQLHFCPGHSTCKEQVSSRTRDIQIVKCMIYIGEWETCYQNHTIARRVIMHCNLSTALYKSCKSHLSNYYHFVCALASHYKKKTPEWQQEQQFNYIKSISVEKDSSSTTSQVEPTVLKPGISPSNTKSASLLPMYSDLSPIYSDYSALSDFLQFLPSSFSWILSVSSLSTQDR